MSNDQVIQLSLTPQEVNTILAAMGELPAKVSMNVIQKIQAQAASQYLSTRSPVDEVGE